MMKRCLITLLAFLPAFYASATYVTVPVTGFNEDIVANGVGIPTSSATNTADGGIGTNGWVFVDQTFSYNSLSATSYLPAGGLINSVVASTPGLQFQLASYSASNALRLQSNSSGMLTFTTPQSAAELFVAAYCGNGNIPMNITVNFTDGTTQVMTGVTVQDWFFNTGFAIQGVSRVTYTSGVLQNSSTDPRIYQIAYSILPANYSKLIGSLSISTGTSANNPTYATLGVMAVTVNTPMKVVVTPSATAICAGTAVTFTAAVTGTTGTLTYQWKKNGVNVGTNTSTYTDNALTSTDVITVTVTSSLTTSVPNPVTSTGITTTITAVPTAPASITGPNPICLNSTNTFTAAAVTGATAYTWTIPAGWSAASLSGISITPTAGPTGGTLTVAASNVCGTGPIASLVVNTVSNATPSVVISNVSPGTTICASTPVTFTATPANGGATPSYQWKKNGNNVGTNNATYTDNALANNDQITVIMTSSLGCVTPPSGTSATVIMTVNSTPSQPGVISGSAAVCNTTTQSYSIVAVPGATAYTWTAPAGWTGSSTGSNINYTAGAASGFVTVTASNVCGTSAASTLAVTSTSTPVTPGTINGNTAPCAFSAQTYSVAAVSGATTYTWGLPAGWSGGSSTTSITATTSASSGNVTVTAGNQCGTSAAASLPVTTFAVSPAPGAITGNASPCSGTQQTYSVAPVAGATSYNWFLPNGWAGFSATNTITVATTAGGGLVQVSANNSCGFSTSATLAVNPVLSVTPSVLVTTPTNNICQNSSATFTATPSGGGTAPTYVWKKNGVIMQSGPNPIYTDNFLVNGDQVTATMTSNAPCATATTVTSPAVQMLISATVIPGININTTPPVINCAGTLLTFTSNSTGGGASPAYQWYLNGNPIQGATGVTYASSAMANGDTLTVRLTSSAACPSQNIVFSNKVGLTIQNNVTPTVTITANPGFNVGSGAVVTFTANYTGGGATPTFQWYKNGPAVPFATGPTYTTGGLHNGDLISVNMVSYLPCANPDNVTSSMVEMHITTGIAAASGSWAGTLNLYPNPSTGHFTISADWGSGHDGERVKMDLVNAIGQSVYHTEVVPARAQWSVDVTLDASIANGVYQLRLSSADAKAARAVLLQR